MSSSFENFAEHNDRFKHDPRAPRPSREPRLRLKPEVEVLLKLLAALFMFLVGAVLFVGWLWPGSEFETPPDSITVRNLKVVSEDGTWISGLMVNQSDRSANRVVFELTYRGNGQPIQDYVVQEGLPAGEFRPFKVLARGGTAGRTVVTDEPQATPFHVEWSPQ